MMTLLIVGLAACGGLLVLETFIRRPVLVAALVMATQLAAAVTPIPSLYLGGFRVGIDDVVMTIVLAAAFARLLRFPLLTGAHRAGLGILAVTLLTLVRGIVEFGVAPAVVQSRGMLPFIVTLVYFSTVVPSQRTVGALGRIWLWSGCMLAGLAVLRWAAAGLGVQGIELLQPTASFGRVLQFSEAFVVAQAALLALTALMVKQTEHAHRRIAYFLLPVTVLLQHRTAWAVLAVGLILMLFLDHRVGRRLATAAVAAVAMGAVLSFTVLASPDQDVTDSLAETATTTDTFEWRTEGWGQLLEAARDGDAVAHALGEPLGTRFTREIADSGVTESQPHNYYLHLYLRLGLAGLGLTLFLYLRTLTRLWQGTSGLASPKFDSPMLIVMLAMHLTMFISYAPKMEQGILIGLGIAVATHVVRDQPGPETGEDYIAHVPAEAATRRVAPLDDSPS